MSNCWCKSWLIFRGTSFDFFVRCIIVLFDGIANHDSVFFVITSRCAAERKVNQMVNRIRLVKVHVCILGTLRSLTPAFFGKKKSRQRIMSNLHVIMENVRVQFDLSKGDMPDPVEFACCLENFPDFSVFPSIDNALIHRLNRLLEVDIPGIVSDAETIATDIRLGRNKKEEIQVQDKIPKDITESCTIELTNPQSSEV